MTLIVGLGNPGKEYENTRHNVGWRVIDAFSSTLDGTWKTDKKLNAQIFSELSPVIPSRVEGSRLSARKLPVTITLLKPFTFMNNSGSAVATVFRRTKTKKISTLIVLHDDIDLPLGTVRVSFGSSSGGHNGVKSIIDHLSTKDFWRFRIGVAPIKGEADWKQKIDPATFVLKPFTRTENSQQEKMLPRILSLLRETIDIPRVQTVK